MQSDTETIAAAATLQRILETTIPDEGKPVENDVLAQVQALGFQLVTAGNPSIKNIFTTVKYCFLEKNDDKKAEHEERQDDITQHEYNRIHKTICEPLKTWFEITIATRQAGSKKSTKPAESQASAKQKQKFKETIDPSHSLSDILDKFSESDLVHTDDEADDSDEYDEATSTLDDTEKIDNTMSELKSDQYEDLVKLVKKHMDKDAFKKLMNLLNDKKSSDETLKKLLKTKLEQASISHKKLKKDKAFEKKVEKYLRKHDKSRKRLAEDDDTSGDDSQPDDDHDHYFKEYLIVENLPKGSLLDKKDDNSYVQKFDPITKTTTWKKETGSYRKAFDNIDQYDYLYAADKIAKKYENDHKKKGETIYENFQTDYDKHKTYVTFLMKHYGSKKALTYDFQCREYAVENGSFEKGEHHSNIIPIILNYQNSTNSQSYTDAARRQQPRYQYTNQPPPGMGYPTTLPSANQPAQGQRKQQNAQQPQRRNGYDPIYTRANGTFGTSPKIRQHAETNKLCLHYNLNTEGCNPRNGRLCNFVHKCCMPGCNEAHPAKDHHCAN